MRQALFGKEPGPGRQIYLDYLRVIATVFVICVHTVSLASVMTPPKSMAQLVLEIFNFTFLSCNLLFIMVSGALLLPVRGETTFDFFRKRFFKVAVPMVVYYILYVCAKEGIEWLFPDHWFSMARRILLGAPEEAPHFWLIYVILLLYILTPFFRYVVQNVPDNVLSGVILVIFCINGIETYAPVFGFDAHLSSIVDSFAGVFLLGYFLTKTCSRKLENLFLAGGAVSFLISCFLILKTDTYGFYIFQNAPTMMLFSSALFIIVKRAAAKAKTECLFIRFTSKYSFSILLIHWGILHFVVKQILHVNVLSGGIVGGCLLMIILTFLLSAAGAFLIDNTLILLLQRIACFFCLGFRKGCIFLKQKKYNDPK